MVSGEMNTTGRNPVLFGKSLYSVAKVRTTGRKLEEDIFFYTIQYYSAEKIKCTGQWIFMSLSKADSP